ncbi:PilT protein domain protein [uncultured Desulfobacterium sp.]|uniref:PilT protein domain protein n=1 Tax=uncultured Desulfobacterium sp. TaxID=201089 RepID=A0A445N3F1_9BACT|nr:PilT protein domain protein [uncultured Desulfobacterium sp.]
MKIVLDANVIIAAFAVRGLCESVMDVCLSDHEVMLSEDLLDEILRNLRLKLKLPSNIVYDISKFIREHANISIPVSLPLDVCRDPDDIKILGLAVASNADYIVTGDKDLLVLESFQGIPILTPRSFSEILRSGEK